ncbi:hypothetical protein JCM16358_13570 [Halanaerocella petrolearia]
MNKIKELMAKIKEKLKEVNWKKGLAIFILFFGLGAAFALYQQLNGAYQQSGNKQPSSKVEVVEVKEPTDYDLKNQELVLPTNSQSQKKDEQNQTEKEVTEKEKQVTKKKENQRAVKVATNSQVNNLVMPVNGEIINSQEWYKDQTLDAWKYNPGMDIVAEIGTDVKAAQAGQIERVTKDDFKGVTVVIKHQGNFKTLYSNLQNSNLKEGSQVSRAQVIGKVGDSGGSQNNRLHFEVIKEGENVPPSKYLN